MTIDFKIDQKDFLTHQLFLASRSTRIKRKRRRSKMAVPLFYLAFAVFCLYEDKVWMSILFTLIAILWFFIYPLWERRHYIRHYKGFIKENYKERLDVIATLEFNDDYILAKDNGSDSKVLTTEVEEICEIPTRIFVRLKGGQSFILPKDKIRDLDNLKLRLKELSNHLKIKYQTDEKWEWK